MQDSSNILHVCILLVYSLCPRFWVQTVYIMEAKDIKEKTHAICADFIGGIWKNIELDNLIIESIESGFINYIFKLSLPNDCQIVTQEPRQLLIKYFSDKLNIGAYGIMVENIVALLLSKKKIAPRVYGIFDGGRLEEYIEGRNLLPSDFSNANILEKVVRQLAQIHVLDVPINKTANSRQTFDHLMEKSLNTMSMEKFKDSPEHLRLYEKFLTLNPLEEHAWLKTLIEKVNSPTVFSHGDFHVNNMILKLSSDNSDPVIYFVDYELCGYNYRGMDLTRLVGNFCTEMTNKPPYIRIDWTKMPPDEQLKDILNIYLDEFHKHSDTCIDIKTEFTQIWKELKTFNLKSYFGGILMSLAKPTSEIKKIINLTYLGDAMISTYLKEKNNYLKLYPH